MGMDYSIRFILSIENKTKFWNVMSKDQGLEFQLPESRTLAFRPDESINKYLKEDYEQFEIRPSFMNDGRVHIGNFDMRQEIVNGYIIVEFRAVCDEMSILLEASKEIKEWVLHIAQISDVKYAYIDKESWEPLEVIYSKGNKKELDVFNEKYNNII